MATAVFEPRESRLDRYFFPGFALLMLATVFLGFARSYFLAGMFKAPLPNWLIHLHGAAFTSWILLLITQTSLVAANRVDVHRKLGLVGFGLVCLMVILGTLAATDSLRRAFGAKGSAAEMNAKTFYILPLTDMLIFGTLGVSGVPRAVQSSGAQAAHPGGHHSANASGGGPLADCVYPAPSFMGGRVVYLRIPGVAAGVRRVHHRKSPSRDDLG